MTWQPELNDLSLMGAQLGNLSSMGAQLGNLSSMTWLISLYYILARTPTSYSINIFKDLIKLIISIEFSKI
jgi:hypothetical protein